MTKGRSCFNKNSQYGVRRQTFHPNLVRTSNPSPFLIQLPSDRTSFMGVGSMKLDRVQYLEVFPMLGLRLGFCCLAILNTFWTRDLQFHFALSSARYVSDFAHQRYSLILFQVLNHLATLLTLPILLSSSFDQLLLSLALSAPISSSSTQPLPNPILVSHSLAETSTLLQPHSSWHLTLPNPHSPQNWTF